MNHLEFDPKQSGLNAVFTPWQLKTMQFLWSHTEGVNSRTVWREVNKLIEPETISRASVINFLEDMREMGILSGEEKTGKGGHHWIYRPALDEAGFKLFVAETVLGNLVRDFPEETKRALSKY